MAKKTPSRQLRSTLSEFCSELILTLSKKPDLAHLSVREIDSTNTIGFCAVFDTGDLLEGDVELQIWLDEYLSGPDPQFWVGLVSSKDKDLLPYKNDSGIPLSSLVINDRLITKEAPYTRRADKIVDFEKQIMGRLVFEYYAGDDLFLGQYVSVSAQYDADTVKEAVKVVTTFFQVAKSLRKLGVEDQYMRYVSSNLITVYRNEEKLIKNFVRYMKRKSWDPKLEVRMSSRPAGFGKTDKRRVDVICEKDQLVIYGEAKYCPTTLLRAAIRQAMGQLLDYSQKAEEATNRLIILNERPNERDIQLILSNGFDLAVPKRSSPSDFEFFWGSNSIAIE